MPYLIDFTQKYYAQRKVVLAVSVLLTVVLFSAAVQGFLYAYSIWESPTLGQSLRNYHDLAVIVEELHDEWEEADRGFRSIAPYYLLFWAESPVDVLEELAGRFAELPRNMRPQELRIETGGLAKLSYVLRLHGIGRADQRDEAFSMLQKAFGGRDVSIEFPADGLAERVDIIFDVKFSLKEAPHTAVPVIPDDLLNVVSAIRLMRQNIREHKLDDGRVLREVLSAAERAFMRTLPDNTSLVEWRSKFDKAIDPGAILREMKADISSRNRSMPQELPSAVQLWEGIADRRLPWQRVNIVDNNILVDGVRNLQGFFEGGLPPRRVFVAQNERIGRLRDALTGGYDVSQVFDDGLAARQLEHLLSDWSNAVFDISIPDGRRNEYRGLMLAEWGVVVRPDNVHAGLDFEETIHYVKAIPALRSGFELALVKIGFAGCDERSFVVNSVTAKGVLAVNAGKGE